MLELRTSNAGWTCAINPFPHIKPPVQVVYDDNVVPWEFAVYAGGKRVQGAREITPANIAKLKDLAARYGHIEDKPAVVAEVEPTIAPDERIQMRLC